MARLLSRIFGQKAGTKRRDLPKKRGLRLECLEDRAVPATFLVNTFDDRVANDGRLSLREAISQANATPGPDTIVLQAGKYNISIPGSGEDANRSGDFDVTDTLTIVGAGRAATVIQGLPDSPNTDGIFDAHGPINLAFANLTLRGGGSTFGPTGGAVHAQAANIGLSSCLVTRNISTAISAESGNVTLRNTLMTTNEGREGGAIFAGSGNVVLVDSTVSGNSAQKGGGIFAPRGTTTLIRSTVSLNRAKVDGGGIAAEAGTVNIVNGSSVRRNVAGVLTPGAANGRGGGVFAAAVNVTGSTVSGNVGTIGGGIFATTVSLSGGAVSGNTSQREGGGILARTATLTNSTVSGNSAGGDGAGILATATATLTGSTVSNNSSGGSGGGINATTVTLTGSTVSGNRAAGSGGGISGVTQTLTNSTVRGNSAGAHGGGISAGTVTLTNSTVSDNSAALDGGGIIALTANATRSTVSGNSAGVVGGISATAVELTNSTVSGNSGRNGAGGVSAVRGSIRSSTIVENFTEGGHTGGVEAIGSERIRVKNSIIANNYSPFGNGDVFGLFTSEGHNLIGVGTPDFTAPGDQAGTSGEPLDPMLGDLRNNGGPTQTHAPLPGSPVIDKGDNAGAPATDQRGVARARDGDGNGSSVVDIGAVEG
jgi:predicted outer membrane repeat protein